MTYLDVCKSIYDLHLAKRLMKRGERDRVPEKKIEWDHDIFKKYPTKGWRVEIDPEKTKIVSGFDIDEKHLKK